MLNQIMLSFDLKILEPGHDEEFKLISPYILQCLMLMFSLVQINFHELKTYYRFNGDSSVVVSNTSFSIDQLQPINNSLHLETYMLTYKDKQWGSG